MARRTQGSSSPGEDGFTIIETMVALALVFLVLTGAVATFATGVRNVVGGRQRTGAVSLARHVVEEARAALYGEVGHDLAGDTGLAADPAIAVGPPKTYQGEDLAGAADALYPQHTWNETLDRTRYTVRVYVTWVVPATADPYKRLTVLVTWDQAQHAEVTGVNTEVRVSTFLFPAGIPPDPLVDGTVDVDGGTFGVSGGLKTVEFSRVALFNPAASGALTSLFTRAASGNARSASSVVELVSGSLSGCSVTPDERESECPGLLAGSSADSDAATAIPEHDDDGPVTDVAHTVNAGATFSLGIGSGSGARSASTARSCLACHPVPIGDDDQFAYHASTGTGPQSATVGFDVGPVVGSLLQVGSGSEAVAILDQDAASSSHMLTAVGTLSLPGVDVLALDDGPLGYVAAVRVSPVSITAQAEAGPTAASPAVSGGSVTVDIWDTLAGGALGYRTITLTPGENREETATSAFTVNGANVSLTTTVTSGGKTVDSTTDGSGIITYAEAALTNWLRVDVHVVITAQDADGGTVVLADLMTDFDYGRVAAVAQYEAP